MSVLSFFYNLAFKKLAERNIIGIRDLYMCEICTARPKNDGLFIEYQRINKKVLYKMFDEDMFLDPLVGKVYNGKSLGENSSVVVFDSRTINRYFTKEETQKGYITRTRLKEINSIFAK